MELYINNIYDKIIRFSHKRNCKMYYNYAKFMSTEQPSMYCVIFIKSIWRSYCRAFRMGPSWAQLGPSLECCLGGQKHREI